MSTTARFKLIFRVPETDLQACKSAIFAVGAGRYPGAGNYTECCWTVIGTSQFRPGEAANPNIGSRGVLEKVKEVRVETLCVGEEVAREAVQALKRLIDERFLWPKCWSNRAFSAHPYEEPGYEVYRLVDF